GKLLIAAIPLGVVMFFLKDWTFLNDLHVILRFAIVTIIGAIVYAVFGFLLKAEGLLLFLKRKNK
ncbi:murein biosynthesis protein MurJ, partial [Priestia megaterium]